MLYRTLSLVAASLLWMTALPTQASSGICPKPTTQPITEDTTVFFYQRVKNKQTLYIPVMILQAGKIRNVDKTLMPATITLFNLQNDQPVKIHFENTFNPTQDFCQSIGTSKTSIAKKNVLPTQLYANKPLAKTFNFAPEATDLSRFSATIKNPCKNGKAQYDKNGIAVCNIDQLFATSTLVNDKQYWHLQQYRHDVGLTISTWDNKTQHFTALIEDCTECSD